MEVVRAHHQKVPPDPLPQPPGALDHLWEQFKQLTKKRQSGMAANPISYFELESFSRQTGWGRDLWETGILMEMDDVALATWRGEQAAAIRQKERTPEEQGLIPASDVKTIGNMLRGLARRKAVEAAKGLLGRGKGKEAKVEQHR